MNARFLKSLTLIETALDIYLLTTGTTQEFLTEVHSRLVRALTSIERNSTYLAGETVEQVGIDVQPVGSAIYGASEAGKTECLPYETP